MLKRQISQIHRLLFTARTAKTLLLSFSSAQSMSSAMDVFWAAPPISRYAFCYLGILLLKLMSYRTIAAGAFTLSILIYMEYLPAHYVTFYLPSFLRLPPQIWRIFTSFLITGPKISILFDTYYCKDPQTILEPVH